jgi:hypothetical protein
MHLPRNSLAYVWQWALARTNLAANAQLLNERLISLRAASLQILQEPSAPGNHGKQTSARVMILQVRLEVLGQLGDPLTQDRYLHFWGTGIRGMDPVSTDHPAFNVCRQCHLEWMLLVFS